MTRRASVARAERRASTFDGRSPMDLPTWLEEPEAIARRGEVYNVVRMLLESYDYVQRQRRWYRRLWRWIIGRPGTIVDVFTALRVIGSEARKRKKLAEAEAQDHADVNAGQDEEGEG